MFFSRIVLHQLPEMFPIKVSTHEFEKAISWLRNTASSRDLSEEERRIYQYERPWTLAPTLIAHGQINDEAERKPTGLIRWLQHPERNCNIEFDAGENIYSVQVKTVYYAIVSAMFHRVSHVVVYSPNDIVVKVGNGVYKAKKEARLFQSIIKRTGMNGSSYDTSVKLCLLDDNALKRLKLSRESVFTREGVGTCSEDLLREQYSSEVIRM